VFRILVAVDGSAYSDHAVKALIRSLPQYREPPEVHLLNVQHPFPGTIQGVHRQAEQAHRDDGLRALASARSLLEEAGVRYAEHVGVGEAAEFIARYARDRNVDQIVIGTRGRGAVAGLLLGSTARKVVHLVDVPVLLVK
jgi:nucleotide-binding universal stress UspA family protein